MSEPKLWRRRLSLALLLCTSAFAPALAGCEQKEAKSAYEVESTQKRGALSFFDRLDAETKSVAAGEATVKKNAAGFAELPQKLTDPPWDVVESVVIAADAAGKDGAYADDAREQVRIKRFFEEEREAIVKKAGGAAQYAAKEKNCEVDLWGAVNKGLKDGVDEQLKERLRKHNDAFLIIERNREALGKKNVTPLEDEADRISEASYLVHVELPDAKLRLDGYIADISSAKSGLQDFIKEEQEFQASGKAKPEDVKASNERIKAADQKLANVESVKTSAEEAQRTLEQRIKDLQAEYDKKLGELKDAIAAKKK